MIDRRDLMDVIYSELFYNLVDYLMQFCRLEGKYVECKIPLERTKEVAEIIKKVDEAREILKKEEYTYMPYSSSRRKSE